MIYGGFFMPFLSYGILDSDIYCMEKLTREQIEEKLNELLVLNIPKLNPTELKLIKKKPKPVDPIDELDEEEPEDLYPDVVKDDRNITTPAEIVRIKYQMTECSDCGDLCKNRQVKIKYYPDSIRPHRRDYCLTCERARNPWTGEFNVEKSDMQDLYSAYERESICRARADSKYAAYKKPQQIKSSDK
jgi:hypothetical protein